MRDMLVHNNSLSSNGMVFWRLSTYKEMHIWHTCWWSHTSDITCGKDSINNMSKFGFVVSPKNRLPSNFTNCSPSLIPHGLLCKKVSYYVNVVFLIIWHFELKCHTIEVFQENDLFQYKLSFCIYTMKTDSMMGIKINK